MTYKASNLLWGTIALAVAILVVALLWWDRPSHAAPTTTGVMALDAIRPGTPVSEGDQRLTADGAVTSSKLKANSIYLLRCVQDAHYAVGGSSVAATTFHQIIFGGSPGIVFRTSDTALYLSVIKDSTTGYCYLGEEI